MDSAEFEKLVAEALDSLPENIRKKMDNVEVVVEQGSPRGPYLGLYQGVPKTAYGRGFGMVLPDKITIFQAPLERAASSRERAMRTSSSSSPSSHKRDSALKEIVKNVVWHEVAHHFGFSEKGVRKLEERRNKR